MDAVIYCFAVVGIIVVAFALCILLINGISYLITTIKNVKIQVQIAREHNELLGEAKRDRLARKREQIVEEKNQKLERELEKKRKRAAFQDKKAEMQQKSEDEKNQKYLEKLAAKNGEIALPEIEDKKEEKEITEEFLNEVEKDEK